MAVSRGRADQYRRHAHQCLEVASTFHSHEARDILLHMAQVWLRLAENYEEAQMIGQPKGAGDALPVAQQQQQIQAQDKDKTE
jgi:hypothetical protein